jgi:aminoglycoside 6-adenylyltransferase
MRSENEIKFLILNVAKADDRIRVVILNGSRANPKVKKDVFQDYDILFMVTEMETFIRNHNWIDIFGKRLILQIPEEMILSEEENENNATSEFHYLMLLEDDNRIDLTLFPLEKIKDEYIADSLSILLLDKDNLFHSFPPPTDYDYLIKKPTQKEFTDCCNEF